VPHIIEGNYSAKGKTIGIVAGRFNALITEKLVAGAIDCIIRHEGNDKDISVAWCPGAFEITAVAKKMVASKKYDAVICLGAVIRGGTPHFDYVAGAAAKAAAAKKESAAKADADKTADQTAAPEKKSAAKAVKKADKKDTKADAKKADAKADEKPKAAAKKDDKSDAAASTVPLFKAPKGDADDLTKIKGIGPVAKDQLAEQGITQFAQVAKLTDKEVVIIDEAMPFSAEQISDWRAQAKEMIKG